LLKQLSVSLRDSAFEGGIFQLNAPSSSNICFLHVETKHFLEIMAPIPEMIYSPGTAFSRSDLGISLKATLAPFKGNAKVTLKNKLAQDKKLFPIDR
jgi:hypothetical protein